MADTGKKPAVWITYATGIIVGNYILNIFQIAEAIQKALITWKIKFDWFYLLSYECFYNFL